MPNTQREEGFVVVGVSARVRNDDPAAIGALWDQFRSRDLRAEIGGGASEEVYCVYHDYDGGFADPYRMTIGHRVLSTAEGPSGLYRAHIPGQQVAMFRTEGPQPQTLISQWQAIWKGDLTRAYVADYDLYDAENPERVTVHVGLKDA